MRHSPTIPAYHTTASVLVLAACLLAAACSSSPRRPQPLDYSAYQAIAVLPFQTDAFLLTYGAEIADQIIIEIIERDPSFPIVERAHVDEVFREHRLLREGVQVPANAALLPADLILTGSVSFAVENVQSPGPVRQACLSATVRAFETRSGRIVWAGRFSGLGEDLLEYEANGELYRYLSDAEIRDEAVWQLARAIVDGLFGQSTD